MRTLASKPDLKSKPLRACLSCLPVQNRLLRTCLPDALSLTSVQNLKAQEKRESTPAATQVIDQEKDRRVDIPSENLPETISEDLLDNYKDAQIIKSWKWVNDEGEIVKYEVQLDKQGQDLRLKYDTEGKPMTLRKEKK